MINPFTRNKKSWECSFSRIDLTSWRSESTNHFLLRVMSLLWPSGRSWNKTNNLVWYNSKSLLKLRSLYLMNELKVVTRLARLLLRNIEKNFIISSENGFKFRKVRSVLRVFIYAGWMSCTIVYQNHVSFEFIWSFSIINLLRSVNSQQLLISSSIANYWLQWLTPSNLSWISQGKSIRRK